MKRPRTTPVFAALIGLAAVTGTGTAAAASPVDDIVRFDLLPGWRTESGTQVVGFQLTLASGWKTYWRAPGEAGIPPELNLAGSRNLAQARFHWPVPEVFEQGGMDSIGYVGQVVLPVELTLDDAAAPALMAGRLDIGVCRDVCVPVSLEFSTELPVGGDRDAVLAVALADRPMTAKEAGVSRADCRVEPGPKGMTLTATLDLPALGADETVVVESGDPAIWSTPSAVRRDGNRLVAETALAHASGKGFALDRSALVITVIGDGSAVEIQGCPAG